MLRTYGFLSFKVVGKSLDLSRQAIQLRLRRAHTKGDLDTFNYERLRPQLRSDNISREYSLSPENDAFIQDLVNKFEVFPATVVDAAVTRYRETLGS